MYVLLRFGWRDKILFVCLIRLMDEVAFTTTGFGLGGSVDEITGDDATDDAAQRDGRE